MIHSDAWAEGVGQEFQAQGVQECVCVCVCDVCVCGVCVLYLRTPHLFFLKSFMFLQYLNLIQVRLDRLV